MTTTSNPPSTRPNLFNRIRSRQAGHPSGLLGRAIGRLMVKNTARANDRAIELLELTGKSTILEVGFGQGRTVAGLVDRGHIVLGVDVSETMVDQATARNRAACRQGRAKLVLGDGRTMPFGDATVDAAFTAHTVYFMPDPQTTFNEVARMLRSAGRFVVACRVADDGIPEWMDRSVYRLQTADAVKTMLEAAGFERVEHHPADGKTDRTSWFVAERCA